MVSRPIWTDVSASISTPVRPVHSTVAVHRTAVSRKDLALVREEAQRNGARLPVTALVDQFYADVQHMGGRRWDTSSLIRRLR